RCLFWSVCP
uniref:Conopeptide-pc n=1 Tax=Conus pictus TaxID=1042615 RepID=CUPC_CONPB|nr:RecName: Full=Conopeptide-pc [Conus pictus]